MDPVESQKAEEVIDMDADSKSDETLEESEIEEEENDDDDDESSEPELEEIFEPSVTHN